MLNVTEDNFDAEVTNSPLPVVLDCWAVWCMPCQRFAPVFEAVAKQFAGTLAFAKLNVDEQPALASRFEIRSIPTTLILNKGEEFDRIVGMLPDEAFRRKMEDTHRRIASGDY